MAEPGCVRRVTDQEGQKLQQIVRRGSTSTVRYRRTMMLPASAGGNRVPVIAQFVQAHEDTVRGLIHRFNEIGLACLDPQWAGGRPRQLTPDDEDFAIQATTTREALRCLLARRGITFPRTRTWKKSPDPARDTKLDRVEEVLEQLPDRAFAFAFAFDEFGPLGIRPTGGSGCAPAASNPRPSPSALRTHRATRTELALQAG